MLDGVLTLLGRKRFLRKELTDSGTLSFTLTPGRNTVYIIHSITFDSEMQNSIFIYHGDITGGWYPSIKYLPYSAPRIISFDDLGLTAKYGQKIGASSANSGFGLAQIMVEYYELEREEYDNIQKGLKNLLGLKN